MKVQYTKQFCGTFCKMTPLIDLKLGFNVNYKFVRLCMSGPGTSVGIATDYGLDGPDIESRWGEIFRYPDWPWGPPSLLYNGYRVFPGGKVRLGRAVDHSSPSNAAVKKG
jgi:hypothetical protein